MSVVRVLITIPSPQGIPEDQCVNTWYCQPALGQTDEVAAAEAFISNLAAFYNGLDTWFSWETVTNTWSAKAYDLQDARPRTPIVESTFTVPGANVFAYPRELAVCLSYKGSYSSGEVRARNRGRVYIGPLAAGTGSTSAGDVRVQDAKRAQLAGYAGGLCNAAQASEVYDWVVYSPTNDSTNQGIQRGPSSYVVGGWVDNAFDIQRRRGKVATGRTLWGT